MHMKEYFNKTMSSEDCVEWNLSVDLSMVRHSDGLDEVVDGSLYQDEQYGYYDRRVAICSNLYYATFRFDKNKMRDILGFVMEHSPFNLENYLMSIDGCEIIHSDRKV